jgi:pimeloyl-ACP methyl ester carboxylesterase
MIEELEDLAVAEGLLERSRALDIPALVRVGELDLAAPPAHSKRLAAALPRARLQIVPGRGHALLLEDFEATRDAVRTFIAELPV